MKFNWLALIGEIQIGDGFLRYIPPDPSELIAISSASPSATVGIFHALARASVKFEQGKISCKILVKSPDARVQFGLPSSTGGTIFAGFNSLGALYGFGIFRNNTWEGVSGSGQANNLPVEQWIDFSLQVKGSELLLLVNEVEVLKVVHQILAGPVDLFLQSSETIEVSEIKIETKRPQCFVVMQFTDDFNTLYKDVIRPICEEFGYEVIRADDFYTSGLIIEDIKTSIREASFIIADVTPNNANVFYEVGYAHGIGKPTILLSDRTREKLPFDIAGTRTLFYDNTIGGKAVVEERLRKHLTNLG